MSKIDISKNVPQTGNYAKPEKVAAPTTSNNRGASGVTYMFGQQNYMLMIAGLVLIAIGFMCMAGGRSEDPHVFNYDEIYSFRRITLAPILVVLGFIVEIFAIMWLPKEEQ